MEASPLPSLRSYKGEAIPSNVLNQLQYLHTISHSTAATSLPIAHSSSLKFVELVNHYNIALPATLRDAYCSKCCMVQVASITRKSRLISVENGDRMNKQGSVVDVKKGKRGDGNNKDGNNGNNGSSGNNGNESERDDKIRNRVVDTCLICHMRGRRSSKRHIKAMMSLSSTYPGPYATSGGNSNGNNGRDKKEEEKESEGCVGVRRSEYRKMRRKREREGGDHKDVSTSNSNSTDSHSKARLLHSTSNGSSTGTNSSSSSKSSDGNMSLNRTYTHSAATTSSSSSNAGKAFSFSASRANASPGTMLSTHTSTVRGGTYRGGDSSSSTSLIELERIRKKQRRLQNRK